MRVLLVDSIRRQRHMGAASTSARSRLRSTGAAGLATASRRAEVGIRRYDLIPPTATWPALKWNWSTSSIANRVKSALESIAGQYEFILLDCPPALNMLTLNGLVQPMQ